MKKGGEPFQRIANGTALFNRKLRSRPDSQPHPVRLSRHVHFTSTAVTGFGSLHPSELKGAGADPNGVSHPLVLYSRPGILLRYFNSLSNLMAI